MIKRIGSFFGMLGVISFLSFGLMHMAPGDPLAMVVNPQWPLAEVERIRHLMGLDQVWWKQYLHWVFNLLNGNWGFSIQTGRPVLETIIERVPLTLLLTGSSSFLAILFSLGISFKLVQKQSSRLDQLMNSLAIVFFSIPSFWLALLMIWFFSVQLGILPSSGVPVGENAHLFHSLILPISVLALLEWPFWFRYQNVELNQIWKSGYIKSVRARGLSTLHLFRHLYKNLSLTQISLLGLSLPSLLGGAVIIEKIFAIPGMGQLAVNAMLSRDYPVMMGLAIFTSSLVLIGNGLADWALSYLDPRIRFKQKHDH